MTSKLQRFLLTGRPFLWWWAVVVPFAVASYWLEHGISYDDGGLGSVVFVGLITIGLPFSLAGQFFASIAAQVGLEPASNGVADVIVHLVGGSVPFVAADRLSRWWARDTPKKR